MALGGVTQRALVMLEVMWRWMGPLENLPSSAGHPGLHPHRCPLICPTLPKLIHEDVVGYSVKSFDEVKVKNLHCSTLTYPDSDYITEGYWIGQA